MNKTITTQFKYYFTATVTLTIWAMLVWQYLHEGVPIHYLFQNPDLPALSNWWGGLLLPVLSWILIGRMQKSELKLTPAQGAQQRKNDAISFISSLSYGVLLSLSFLYGYNDVAGMMFFGILFFALFLRVYREAFVLGFILRMSITFGAILSTLFAIVIALLSVVVYFLAQFIWGRIRHLTLKKQVT